MGRTPAMLIPMGAVLMALHCAHPVAAQDAEASVRATVEEFTAAWKAGDVERLRRVVAPKGTVVWVSGSGADATVNSQTFEQVLANRKPNPVYELDAIHSIDIVDDRLARVEVKIRANGGVYHDVYVLYQVAGAWRIAVKTFVWFPNAST